MAVSPTHNFAAFQAVSIMSPLVPAARGSIVVGGAHGNGYYASDRGQEWATTTAFTVITQALDLDDHDGHSAGHHGHHGHSAGHHGHNVMVSIVSLDGRIDHIHT